MCCAARQKTCRVGSDRLTKAYQHFLAIFGRYRRGKLKLIWALMSFRELRREKVWSRIHLVPLLLAEGDRDAYRRQLAALEREKEIMKDVKGWQVRVSSIYLVCVQSV
jgi:hypothetical protein